ncbi:MAG: Na/Pi symporter [Candidatus Cybelea sp.]|jgi:phosphate:Na+ symporter
MNVFAVVAGLLGGLALFLFGVDRISRALQAVGGDSIRNILERLSKNAVSGALTGVVVTAILQASAVTIAIAIGFVSTNLMTLEQAIPIVLGSNVGTTSTAYLASVDIGPWAYLLIVIGFVTIKFAKRQRIYHIGSAVIALGLILVGLELMKDSMNPLRSWDPFVELMAATSHPLVGIALGFAITALVQSSTATIGMAVTLASTGLLGLDGGIAILLGANIGSVVMPIIASLDKSAEAKRVAGVQVIFNVLGVALWTFLIPFLALIAERVAPTVATQLAFANTFFNTVNLLIFLPFTPQLAALARKIVPGPTREEPTHALDPDLIATPTLAIGVAWQGVAALGQAASASLSTALSAAVATPPQTEEGHAAIEPVRREIIEYLGRIGASESLDPAQRRRLVAAIVSADTFATVGTDVVANLMGVAQRRADAGLTFAFLQPAVDAASRLFAQCVAQFEAFPASNTGKIIEASRALDLPSQRSSIIAAGAPSSAEVETYEMSSWVLTQVELVAHATREVARALEDSRPNE